MWDPGWEEGPGEAQSLVQSHYSDLLLLLHRAILLFPEPTQGSHYRAGLVQPLPPTPPHSPTPHPLSCLCSESVTWFLCPPAIGSVSCHHSPLKGQAYPAPIP